jgi:hypothetical protein
VPVQSRTQGRRDRTHYLYIAVIVAAIAGAVVGLVAPDAAVELKPIGTGFVNLIKMMISPIIFCTIVLGVGSVRKAAKVGKVGGLALGYFLVMSFVALAIGLVVGNILQPGDGLHLTDALKDAGQAQAADAPAENLPDFLLGIIPVTLVSAFTEGQVLQTLLVALLVGFGLQAMGSAGEPILCGVGHIQKPVFSGPRPPTPATRFCSTPPATGSPASARPTAPPAWRRAEEDPLLQADHHRRGGLHPVRPGRGKPVLPAHSLVLRARRGHRGLELPFGRWGETFSDDVVAAAMIDRLVHHARTTALGAGESQGPPAIQPLGGSPSALSQSGQGFQDTGRDLDADSDLPEFVGHRPRLSKAHEVVLRCRGERIDQGVRQADHERRAILRYGQHLSRPRAFAGLLIAAARHDGFQLGDRDNRIDVLEVDHVEFGLPRPSHGLEDRDGSFIVSGGEIVAQRHADDSGIHG